jgi:hypothetical protein
MSVRQNKWLEYCTIAEAKRSLTQDHPTGQRDPNNYYLCTRTGRTAVSTRLPRYEFVAYIAVGNPETTQRLVKCDKSPYHSLRVWRTVRGSMSDNACFQRLTSRIARDPPRVSAIRERSLML